MCCRVSTLMCLLFCWNPTPVSFSTISEGFLKLSCRHMRYLLFPPGHLLLVCPPPPLNVPFSYQGHPVVGTQAPWKHLPWNPVYFSQMEGLPWGDPPPPHVCLRFWLAYVSRCLKGLPLLVQLMRGRGCMTASTARQFCLFTWLWTNILAANYLSTGVKETFSFEHCQPCL